METAEVLRTTFAARDFTADPVPDEILYEMIDRARFAPSGGNRQGWRVIVVRDPEVKRTLGQLCIPALRIYNQQRRAGENPWNSVIPSKVDPEAAKAIPTRAIPMFDEFDKVPVALVVTVDLTLVASMDKELDRIGVISGGSVYPFAWGLLLAARDLGYGGALTTLIASAEPQVQELLGIPSHHAVAALIPVGKPVKQLTKLSRKPVEEIAVLERFDGKPFTR